jgi:hypothetical protein
MTLDNRIIYIDYEAFLAPMLDLSNYHPGNTNILRAKFNKEYTHSSIKSTSYISAGSQILVNIGFSNINYLMYHGLSFHDNDNDCYLLTLSFSERQDDNLRVQRSQYFSKYFLYDKNDSDEM